MLGQWTVKVVEWAEGVPDSAAVRRLDAFTVREEDGSMRPKVYLNRDAFVVREAVKGTDFYVKVLAAIVVHEAAHLSGGSEADARRAESRFFADLIAWRRGRRTGRDLSGIAASARALTRRLKLVQPGLAADPGGLLGASCRLPQLSRRTCGGHNSCQITLSSKEPL